MSVVGTRVGDCLVLEKMRRGDRCLEYDRHDNCFCRVYKKGVRCCASVALVANVASNRDRRWQERRWMGRTVMMMLKLEMDD